jgi:diamine N-acetyltransferase
MSVANLDSELRGAVCTLVPMAPEHTEHVVRWRNHPLNAQWFKSKAAITAEGHLRWLEKTRKDDSDFNWVIQAPSGELVGAIGLYNIDWEAGRGEYGRVLIGDPEHRGKGYGREASKLVIAAASEAGLKRVWLEVYPDNQAASTLYESLGFRLQGESEGMNRYELAL